MTSDENLNPQLEEEFAKHLPQILAAWGDFREKVAASSAISGTTRSDHHNIPPGPSHLPDTPSRMAAMRAIAEIGGLSSFDSRLLFITGPETTNLVLCFFLSNPKKKYSREDVFAHLNRECEEQGVSEFFVEADWGFSVSSKDVKNKSGLKMGRSTILRVVENLRKLGLLEALTNGKYRLNRGSRKVVALQRMLDDYLWDLDEDFQDFKVHIAEYQTRRKIYVHSDNFEELVRQYVAELEGYNKNNSKFFRSKLSRLSHYCDIEEDESYSSVSRLIIGNNEENNWIMKIFNEKEWDNERLRKICINIGHEDNPALSRKTKAKLIDYIVKNSP